MPYIEQKYNGNDKKSLTIETDEIEGLNFALEGLKYKSTKYEPKGSTDIITVRFQDYKERARLLDYQYRLSIHRGPSVMDEA